MNIGDWIAGAGLICMLVAATGLEGNGWKSCLLLVLASAAIMMLGFVISKFQEYIEETDMKKPFAPDKNKGLR